MMRSLWSAVSGLNTHLTEMDVIGNNISNVNTTAYKSQGTGFQDVLYQTVKSGSAASNTLGATNYSQVGLGAKLGSIYTNVTAQGSAVTTNNILDLMITGDSFFVVEQDGVNSFSRDGAFTIDAEGYLVTQNNGYYVKGVNGGNVTNAAPDRLQVIAYNADLNGDGVNDTETIAGSATTAAYFKGNIDSQDSTLEEGKTLRLEVFGTDGNTYTLKFTLTDAGDDEDNTFSLLFESATDEDGNIYAATDDQEAIELVYSKSDGTLESAAGGTGIVNMTFTGEAPISTLAIDFSNTHNYAGTLNSHSSTIYGYRGDTEGLNQGYANGTLSGISISTDGSIYGKYTSGQSVLKGQIAVAEFTNAMGLEKIGDNLYAASLNSGAPTYMDITSDGGYMSSGVLEGSNVDLAKEFTDMITTQRGFQANSRVITTSDEILQLLHGLKR